MSTLITSYTFPDLTMLINADGPCEFIEDHPGVITRPYPPSPDESFDCIIERCETCGRQWGSHRTIRVVFDPPPAVLVTEYR